MEPLGFITAVRATEEHVNSARPNARVVPHRDPVRLKAANALRRMADWLEPRPCLVQIPEH